MATSTLQTGAPIRAGYITAGLLFIGIVALAVAPFWADRAELRLLMEALSYVALAQMWNLLAGYTGLVSVGQQAYVGIGGYLFFALTIFGGLPILAAMPLAALGAALIALPTGWVAFRLQGAYFAIGTWVIAEVFRLAAAQVSALGGGSGVSLPVKIAKSLAASRPEREMVMYYIAFAIALLQADGKLDVDDDIREYLPEMPDYGAPITIRHLLHHTSGIRDYLGLKEIAGLPLGFFHHDQDVVDLIARQKALTAAWGELEAAAPADWESAWDAKRREALSAGGFEVVF